MALFKKTKKEMPKKEALKPVASIVVPLGVSFSSRVIIRPRVTEKATDLAGQRNAYVFDVAEDADKKTISRAILALYKVKPVKIAVINIPRKKIIVRGKRGISGGGKKAYVYLKVGDKIEII